MSPMHGRYGDDDGDGDGGAGMGVVVVGGASRDGHARV